MATTVLLFALIFGLGIVVQGDTAEAALALFVAPIAVCAVNLGTRGGVAASLIATALLIAWDTVVGHGLGPVGVTSWAIAYLIAGGLLGRFVDQKRALAAEVERHHELSLDLVCTANFNGYFVELNPAWERTLGYTNAELTSRPFLDFVHPDDRGRTEAEAAKLAETDEPTVSFRNRYRKADGDYLWLEWTARGAVREQRIYATARDITIQRQAEEALQAQNNLLERGVRERTQDLEDARLETLHRLAITAEYRDDDTHQHTERVGRTAALLARELGLSDETVALIRQAAPLHDIGKVGIPDTILLKPGKLTDEEFELMKEHAEIGAKILADGQFAVVRLAEEIALTHHERWDGGGYPDGLPNEAIPLAGRITAVADVFDALTHERPYKRAWPIEDAVSEIEGLAGTHFDPRVIRAFLALDHQRLLETVEDYDLDLPPPPLTRPIASEQPSSGAELATGRAG
jgi:PAS domain S-box-containing protein/putative nucleotidyltransferase with HDIG domain